MFPTLFLGSFSVSVYHVIFSVAVCVGLFLFWRAARYELIESNLAFDLTVVGISGALIFGRVMEFVLDSERFLWSPARLFFFNVYSGFDLWGAILGGSLFVLIFLRSRKVNFWQIFDLAAAPVVFAQVLVAFGNFARGSLGGFVALYYAFSYLVIFWILKRLEKQRKHLGFFACFYLVAISLLDIVLFRWRDDVVYIGNVIPRQLGLPLLFLIFGLVCWWRLAKRNLKGDFKIIFAQVLLVIMGTKRVLTSFDEAGKFSRFLILVPYWFVIFLAGFVKMVGREIVLTASDLLYILGVKKLSK